MAEDFKVPQLIQVEKQSFKDLLQTFGNLIEYLWWLVQSRQIESAKKLVPMISDLRTLILAVCARNNIVDEDIERLKELSSEALDGVSKLRVEG